MRHRWLARRQRRRCYLGKGALGIVRHCFLHPEERGSCQRPGCCLRYSLPVRTFCPARCRNRRRRGNSRGGDGFGNELRSEEHTSELQSHLNLVCRLLLEKKKKKQETMIDD